ncbi:MAG: radical SAM protein [Nitrospirae bacterium]|nr:radical SAM protein [Nitrospirota bacterium]
MKIIISYPPLEGLEGTPLLSQNRQYQVFKKPTYIYPVVPASAATLLKRDGHEVIWNDCIAEGWSYSQFLEFIKREKPDLIALETKTPVVKRHWKIINDLKELSTFSAKGGSAAGGNFRLSTVLMGDHVTALPEESFHHSPVDFVLTGGDYDFLLLKLCNCLRKQKRLEKLSTFSAKGGSATGGNFQLSTKLEPGIYFRDNGRIKDTGKFQLNHDLDSSPFIDRELTKWHLYSTHNGNYKSLPGTYIMAGRDCWYHKCSFCSWTTLYPSFRVRKPEKVLDEIGMLLERHQVKEIMDDTGTFPGGEWLRKFCRGMMERGYNRRVFLDCNMRFGACDFEEYKLMKQANFRLLLFGLESANQATLNRIDKGLKAEVIIESCKSARKAGLYPHITIMFGYPWESYEDALRTLKLGRYLLRKGYAHTVQATMVVPYPGTPLFEECKEKGLLKTLDWDRYDMKEPVMKIPMEDERVAKLVQGIYGVAFNPEFVWRRLGSVKDMDDIKYFVRAGAKIIGHLFDFNHSRSK